MPIRWRFSVFLALGSAGGITTAAEVWVRCCESQNIDWHQLRRQGSSQVPKNQPPPTHSDSCHNPSARARMVLGRCGGQLWSPGWDLRCRHSPAHGPSASSEAEQIQRTRWLPSLLLGQVCELQHSRAGTVLISTGTRPCPSVKAS